MSKLILTFEFDTIAEAAKVLAAMAGNTTAVVTASPKPEPEKAEGKGKAKAPAAAPAAASTPSETGAASSASSTEGTPSASAGEGIPYAELQKAVFKVAGLGVDAKAKVLALAAELGAPTFKELPAAKWAEAKARVEALHAELTAEVA